MFNTSRRHKPGPGPVQSSSGPTRSTLAVSSPGPAQAWPRPGLEIWEPKKRKCPKSKSVSPKMLARSGLVGKESWPHFGKFQFIFSCFGSQISGFPGSQISKIWPGLGLGLGPGGPSGAGRVLGWALGRVLGWALGRALGVGVRCWLLTQN